jgi:hypothetical protein
MTLTWRNVDLIELRDGYSVAGPDGDLTGRLTHVEVAIEGGFMHIRVPGADKTEVVSAPALRHVSY